MAGHLADGVLWFDDETAAWISSRFYFKDGHLPGWVTDWNAAKKIDPFFGKTWNLSVPPAALDRLWKPGNEFAGPRPGLGKTFPHPITGGLDKARQGVLRRLREHPVRQPVRAGDGRRAGAAREAGGGRASPICWRSTCRPTITSATPSAPTAPRCWTPRCRPTAALSDLFRFLARTVPGGLASVTIVLTADHGVAPMVEEKKREGFATALAYQDPALGAAVEGGARGGVRGRRLVCTGLVEYNFYLNLEALRKKGIEPAKAEAVAAEAFRRQPGIYAAYTRGQILEGRMPPTDIARRVVLGFHPAVSGDVVIVLDPYTVPNYSGRDRCRPAPPTARRTPTTPRCRSCSPAPGSGRGATPPRVSTLDIAPTLSDLLGILQPSGCEGHVSRRR